MRERGMRQLRVSPPAGTTGAETADARAARSRREHLRGHARRRAPGPAASPPPASARRWPSVRTTTSAAASRSSRLPARSATISIRRPRRTSAASAAPAIDVRRDLVERVLERGVRDGEPRQHLGAEEARVEATEARGTGPNPSPARPAAATAALQSGWTPSWFAANEYDAPAGDERRPARRDCCSNCASSLATALALGSARRRRRRRRCVPSASSLGEPANARPTRIARTTRRPRRATSASAVERPRLRRRARGRVERRIGAHGARILVTRGSRRGDVWRRLSRFVIEHGQHLCALPD